MTPGSLWDEAPPPDWFPDLILGPVGAFLASLLGDTETAGGPGAPFGPNPFRIYASRNPYPSKGSQSTGPQTRSPRQATAGRSAGDGCRPINSGGGGEKPPGGNAVAAPGGEDNPFKDGGPFKTMDDACGLPPGSLENMQNIGRATGREMLDS